MLRATALSLLVLFSIAVMLPLANSSANNRAGSGVSHRKKRIRRHSRAWWRRYRAHLRRRRARQLQMAQKPNAPEQSRDDVALSPNASAMTGGTYNDPRGSFSLTLPGGWTSRPVSANGETVFRIYAPGGRSAGRAVLSVVPSVAASDGALTARARARALGGVPLANLRRTVIDKMIALNGWVINDLEREINGRRVFVVLAQTAGSSDASTPPQSWAFYFTEMDDRIYSLATSVPLEFSDRLALESAQVMASFRAHRPSTVAADSPPPNH